MRNLGRRLLDAALAGAIAPALLTACACKEDSISKAEATDKTPPSIAETKAVATEAYIYGFPMIAAYKALYQFNVDKTNSQYKGPFNAIQNDAQLVGHHVRRQNAASHREPDQPIPHQFADGAGNEEERGRLADDLHPERLAGGKPRSPTGCRRPTAQSTW